jgi:hypothetical protein
MVLYLLIRDDKYILVMQKYSCYDDRVTMILYFSSQALYFFLHAVISDQGKIYTGGEPMDTYGNVSRILGATDMAPSQTKGPTQAKTDSTDPAVDESSPQAAETSPRSHFTKAKSLQASQEFENKLMAIAGSTREEGDRSQITLPLGDRDVTLRGVDTTKLNYVRATDEEHDEKRKEFNSKWRKDFMKDLGKDPAKEGPLREAGLNDTDFQMMRAGKVPTGFQVHHKIPIDDGGQNEFSNFVLIKNEPAHKAITNFQMHQVEGVQPGESREIDWVIPRGYIYPPDPSYVTTTPRA